MIHRPPIIRIGLPRSIMNDLAREAADMSAPILVSMGSLYDAKKQDFTRIGMAPWFMDAALDSAGFSAMLAGGYRWSVYDHVELVATNSSRVWGDDEDPGPCDLPFPWVFWAAMDFCCEKEIAPNRAEVERRMALTVEIFEETLEIVAGFWNEGFCCVRDLPRPLPTLQGRRPADYVWSAQRLAEAWKRRPLTETEQGDLEYLADLPEDLSLKEREECRQIEAGLSAPLPALVGVGSICGREVTGPEGILPVLDALHAELPATTQLHLFGVKGDVLPYLHHFPGRVYSIDSMAWDNAARWEAGKIRKQRGAFDPSDPDFFSCDLEHRRRHMREWYRQQLKKAGLRWPMQGSLF